MVDLAVYCGLKTEININVSNKKNPFVCICK